MARGAGAAFAALAVALAADRAPVVRRFTVAANSRFTVPVADLFLETAQGNRGYGAVFESEAQGAQPAAQIVVERAMYSNAPGLFWAAGTNQLATRLRWRGRGRWSGLRRRSASADT